MPNNATGYEILHNKSKLWTDVALFWKQMALPVMASCARQLVRIAAKYSPPGIKHTLGNATIPEEYYYCRILNIDAMAKQLRRRAQTKKSRPDREVLVPTFKKTVYKRHWDKEQKRYIKQGHYNRFGEIELQTEKIRHRVQNYYNPGGEIKLYKDDLEEIRKGNKYKIVSNKWGQIPHTIGYTKSMAQAKKMARIVNRGLAKYSWNTLLNNFADSKMVNTKPVKIKTTQIERDKTFNTLARRSPNIKRYTWGNIKFDASDINNWNWKLHGEQRHNADEEYSPLALKLGIVAAGKRWNSLVQAFARQNGKTLQRLLGFKLQSVIANPNTIATGPRYK